VLREQALFGVRRGRHSGKGAKPWLGPTTSYGLTPAMGRGKWFFGLEPGAGASAFARRAMADGCLRRRTPCCGGRVAALARGYLLLPHPGLVPVLTSDPRLAPWAIVCRRSAETPLRPDLTVVDTSLRLTLRFVVDCRNEIAEQFAIFDRPDISFVQ
jgi:hypothetical protein